MADRLGGLADSLLRVADFPGRMEFSFRRVEFSFFHLVSHLGGWSFRSSRWLRRFSTLARRGILQIFRGIYSLVSGAGTLLPFSKAATSNPLIIMAQQSYMPKEDDLAAAVLAGFDDNIASLATKYKVTTDEMLRVKQGRLAFRWLLDDIELGRQWGQSIVEAKDLMRSSTPGAAGSMPAGPMRPTVPQITPPAGSPYDIEWEPGFFGFFSALVARIKATVGYLKSDGDLLHIEGPEIPAPQQSVVPELKITRGPQGCPVLEVPRGCFDGYNFTYKIGAGPEQNGGFVNTRRYVHAIAMPLAGEALVYAAQVQYRYKEQPFGQMSGWRTVALGG